MGFRGALAFPGLLALLCVVAYLVAVERSGSELIGAAERTSTPDSGHAPVDSVREVPGPVVDEQPTRGGGGSAPEVHDILHLEPTEVLRLLEAHEVSVRDLRVLPDATLDEIAILRAEPLLSGWTPTTREAVYEGLLKLPSEIPNPSNKALGDGDMEYLDSIRERHRNLIATLADETLPELELHKQSQWTARRGVQIRREGEPPPLAADAPIGKFRSSQECGMLGRYIRFEYSSFESTALESKLAQIEELKAAMIREQRDYVEALP